jgi:uncharacterized membrane protein
MRSTASISDHPIHPMLIPFPFAFLSGAAAFDIAAAASHKPQLAQTAAHLRSTGIGAALAAAVPGLIDFFGTVPSGAPRKTATVHMISNLSALGCFLAASRRPRRDRMPGRGAIALQVLGTALLVTGGVLGGRLVYHHGVAVNEDTPALGGRSSGETLTPPHGDLVTAGEPSMDDLRRREVH